jgi:2',3'-cyclic-nucleotide 2'-phosphodiesterase (5'-nucleotidase family)
VANIRYTINLSDPATPSVQDVQIKGLDGIYQPLDLSSQYNLVTTSYLAGGGDLYQFEGAANVTDTGHIDADILVQYIENEPGGVLNRPNDWLSIIQ